MADEGYSLIELNKPDDWNNLIDMHKKHVPVIDAPSTVEAKKPFKVKMKIGGIDGVEHPNALGHYINWVELYAGKRYLGRVEFAPEVTDGFEAEISIALENTANLRAQSLCNLHGLWEGREKQVIVK